MRKKLKQLRNGYIKAILITLWTGKVPSGYNMGLCSALFRLEKRNDPYRYIMSILKQYNDASYKKDGPFWWPTPVEAKNRLIAAYRLCQRLVAIEKTLINTI